MGIKFSNKIESEIENNFMFKSKPQDIKNFKFECKIAKLMILLLSAILTRK